MGQGCAYTCNEGDTLAYWVDVDLIFDSQEESIEYDILYATIVDYFTRGEELFTVLEEELYKAKICSSLYDISLESTHFGDGIVIKMEPAERLDPHIYNLAKANFEKNYHALGKRMKKQFHNMRICSGNAWTSSHY